MLCRKKGDLIFLTFFFYFAVLRSNNLGYFLCWKIFLSLFYFYYLSSPSTLFNYLNRKITIQFDDISLREIITIAGKFNLKLFSKRQLSRNNHGTRISLPPLVFHPFTRVTSGPYYARLLYQPVSFLGISFLNSCRVLLCHRVNSQPA